MNNILFSFPQRVYHVLEFCEEQGREDIISWENDGTAFKVNNLQEFERDLLPRYFNTNKYNTFTRALYSYGFTCVRTGRQPGIYSHTSFNRNDPLSPSLIKRVSRKKTTSNHADSNPFLEALKSRSSSRRPGILNGQPVCPFPSLLDERGREKDCDTATVFGRSYHIVPSQSAALLTSTTLPVQRPPGSSVSLGMTNSDGDSMNTRSYPDSTPSASTSTENPTYFHAVGSSIVPANYGQSERSPIASNGNLFMLGRGQVAPIVASSRGPTNGSEQENGISLIPCSSFDRQSSLEYKSKETSILHIPQTTTNRNISTNLPFK